MPILKTFAAASGCRVLTVRNAVRRFTGHRRLKPIVPRMGRHNGCGKMVPNARPKSHPPFSSGMINRALAKCNVPEKMPHLFEFKHRKRVFNVARISAVDSLPIDQLNSALSANADFV